MKYKRLTIGECCTIKKKTIYPEGGIQYCCFSLPGFDNKKTPEILDGDDIKSSKFLIENNMILFNKLNPKFKRIWNIESLNGIKNAICSTEFIPIIPNKNITQDYLYYYISSDEFTNLMDQIKTGTSNSHQRIDLKQFLSIEITLPEIDYQNKATEILKKIDLKIEVNKKINENLAA